MAQGVQLAAHIGPDIQIFLDRTQCLLISRAGSGIGKLPPDPDHLLETGILLYPDLVLPDSGLVQLLLLPGKIPPAFPLLLQKPVQPFPVRRLGQLLFQNRHAAGQGFQLCLRQLPALSQHFQGFPYLGHLLLQPAPSGCLANKGSLLPAQTPPFQNPVSEKSVLPQGQPLPGPGHGLQNVPGLLFQLFTKPFCRNQLLKQRPLGLLRDAEHQVRVFGKFCPDPVPLAAVHHQGIQNPRIL